MAFLHFLLGNAYSRIGLIREAVFNYDLAIFLDLDNRQNYLKGTYNWFTAQEAKKRVIFSCSISNEQNSSNLGTKFCERAMVEVKAD